MILHMLEIGAVQFFNDPLVVGTADIQEPSGTHETVSHSKTELWHRILTHYLPLYCPEAERFHHSSRTDWFLVFLAKYPTPHMITDMSQEAFVADAWQVVGRKVSKEDLLSDSYATAVGSVGLPVHPDSDAVRIFRLVLAEGRSLVRQRDEIEARAVELLSDLPNYQLRTTIPGIGPINAITILAEAHSRHLFRRKRACRATGDLRRFRHHRQVLKFCGMDLATVRSGAPIAPEPMAPSMGNSAAKAGSRSTAMPGYVARSGWLSRRLFSSGPTTSGTSSSDRSPGIDTMRICTARPTPRSSTANPIAPSSRGCARVEGPPSYEPWRLFADLADKGRAFRLGFWISY